MEANPHFPNRKDPESETIDEETAKSMSGRKSKDGFADEATREDLQRHLSTGNSRPWELLFAAAVIIVMAGVMIVVFVIPNGLKDQGGEGGHHGSILPGALKDRMKIVQIGKGPFDLSSVSRDGYYTVVVFSADWCQPCHAIWKEIPDHLDQYSNVVAVRLDFGDYKAGANPHATL